MFQHSRQSGAFRYRLHSRLSANLQAFIAWVQNAGQANGAPAGTAFKTIPVLHVMGGTADSAEPGYGSRPVPGLAGQRRAARWRASLSCRTDHEPGHERHFGTLAGAAERLSCSAIPPHTWPVTR